MNPTALDIAVVGAGPVGLALALHAARVLPHARISLFDRREATQDVGADPRTLALSLGSVQLLQRLGAWPEAAAQPIREVHVSQLPPTLPALLPLGPPEVRIRAEEEGVPMLGAVLRYGELVAPLQQAWLDAAGQAPQRLHSRFGSTVAALKPLAGGVELDAGIAERFDLAVPTQAVCP
jgi:2-octaprenyl-6-methoxyphenol hydroxylase